MIGNRRNFQETTIATAPLYLTLLNRYAARVYGYGHISRGNVAALGVNQFLRFVGAQVLLRQYSHRGGKREDLINQFEIVAADEKTRRAITHQRDLQAVRVMNQRRIRIARTQDLARARQSRK